MFYFIVYIDAPHHSDHKTCTIYYYIFITAHVTCMCTPHLTLSALSLPLKLQKVKLHTISSHSSAHTTWGTVVITHVNSARPSLRFLF